MLSTVTETVTLSFWWLSPSKRRKNEKNLQKMARNYKLFNYQIYISPKNIEEKKKAEKKWHEMKWKTMTKKRKKKSHILTEGHHQTQNLIYFSFSQTLCQWLSSRVVLLSVRWSIGIFQFVENPRTQNFFCHHHHHHRHSQTHFTSVFIPPLSTVKLNKQRC